MNCKEGAQPIYAVIINNTGMHILSFSSQFEMFSCFVLGKRSVNRPYASKSAEKHANDLAKENK